jgi:hypothetical protein
LLLSSPFDNHLHCSGRQIAFNHLQGFDIEQRIIFTINGMEMGRRMIAKKEFDNNSVKSGYFGHDRLPINTVSR